MISNKSVAPNPSNVKTNALLRVVLYLRCSTNEQKLKGTSIKGQLINLKRYCQLYGWQIVKIYADEGFTGGNDNRPQYRLLFHDAANNEFDTVVVWKLDRFSRKQRNLLNGLETLKELGIKFVSASENLDTSTAHGQFAVGMLGTMAEFERDTIAERTREAHEIRVNQGNWGSGKPPLGYRWLKAEKRFEIIEDEAKIVLLIFNLYAYQEMGMVQVTHHLTGEGYSRGSKPWNFRTIHEILHQSAYAGRHRLGIIFPPIITQELWNKTQTRLKEARKVRQDPRGWLLQGLVTCGECGRTLSCESIWHHNYVCRGRYKDTNRENICTMPRFRRDWLEDNVMNELYRALSDNDCIKIAVNNARDELLDRRQSISKASGYIDAKLEAITGKKERLAIVFADGALSEPVYRKQITSLKQQETELAKRRENLDPYAQVEMAEIEQQIKLFTTHLTTNFSDFAWWCQVEEHLFSETLKECNLADSHRFCKEEDTQAFIDRLDEKEQQVFIDRFEKNGIKYTRSLLRLLRVQVIAYNDRVILRGLLSPRALTIVKNEFQPEFVTEGIPELNATELCHVFNYPAKTERKTVN